MVTRNDFELLANALKSERESILVSGYKPENIKQRIIGLSYAANCVAGVCIANNARFDRRRFLVACGIDG